MKRIFFICLMVLLTSPYFTYTSNADELKIVPPDTMIVIVRTPCFGFCPFYKLTIHGDGKIEFIGKGDVDGTGLHVKTISPEKVILILKELDRINFNDLDNISFADLNTPPLTHNSSIILSLTQKNKQEGFYHILGSDSKKDKMVVTLVDTIVDLAEIIDWVHSSSKGI